MPSSVPVHWSGSRSGHAVQSIEPGPFPHSPIPPQAEGASLLSFFFAVASLTVIASFCELGFCYCTFSAVPFTTKKLTNKGNSATQPIIAQNSGVDESSSAVDMYACVCVKYNYILYNPPQHLCSFG